MTMGQLGDWPIGGCPTCNGLEVDCPDCEGTGYLLSVCRHIWNEATANLPVADIGFWRYCCLKCGAYMNVVGRIVVPK